MLKYFDTPIIEIQAPEVEKAGIRLLVKREDLNHPAVSGNKWWKLKFNLEEARRQGHNTILTFGGAFSNHIYATAAAAQELNFKSIGIIRGEEVLPLNETLSFARKCGMHLHFVSREDYREKIETHFIEKLKSRFNDFFLIPEGGTNLLAVEGCVEFARAKLLPLGFDYLCLPVGTGGTVAGIVAGLADKKVIGFSTLKGGAFLADITAKLLREYGQQNYGNWSIQTDYHFGGYAKKTAALDEFILSIRQQHDLPLDPVYTGKMMAGVFDLMKKKYFEKGSTVLAVHTGGLRNLEN